jgi:hypothetical protein
VDTLQKSSMPCSEEPDLAQDATWESTVGRVKAQGNALFKSEQKRMRGLGIVDKRGRAKSKDWPADMTPDSKTDIAT